MLERYAAVLLDLDGVLYRGEEPVPGAAEAVSAMRGRGVETVFITNNSSKTPSQVAEKLARLGFDAGEERVVTSAVALGELLADGADRPVRTAYVVGEDGVREALRSFGVSVLEGEPERADAVVVGWDRSADYARLKHASLLVQRGARLLATNADASYPAADGLWPGAGALLSVITTTTGADAAVAGKPRRALFEAAARASATRGPYLVVGDRLETDVAGAAAMGWDSALVMTGVARGADLLRSPWRPDYLVGSVDGLLADPPRVERAGDGDLPAARRLVEAAGLFARDLDERRRDVAVARGAEGVVGVGALEVRGPDALLRSVAVEPERRGRHVGTALVAALAARARDESVSRVWLLTESAAGFFGALGFLEVPRGELPPAIEESPAAGANCSASAVAMRFDVA